MDKQNVYAAKAKSYASFLNEQSFISGPLPSTMPRSHCAAVAIRGKQLIVMGGSCSGTDLPAVETSTSSTDQEGNACLSSWSTMPKMKIARHQFGAAAVSYDCASPGGAVIEETQEASVEDGGVNRVMVVAAGGFSSYNGGDKHVPSSRVEFLDVTESNDGWKKLPSLTTERGGCAVASYSSNAKVKTFHHLCGVYVVGGYGMVDGKPTIQDSVEFLQVIPSDTVGCINASWNTLPCRMTTGRQDCAAVFLEHDAQSPQVPSPRLVVVGGYTSKGVTDSAEYYSFQYRKWCNLPPMTQARSGHAAVALGTCIFVAGGFNGKTILDTVEFFDFRTRQWKVLPQHMQQKRRGCAAAIVNGHIAIMNGRQGGFGNTDLDSVELLRVLKMETTSIGDTSIASPTNTKADFQGKINLPVLPPVGDGNVVGTQDRAKALADWCESVKEIVHTVEEDNDTIAKKIARTREGKVEEAYEEKEEVVRLAKKEFAQKVLAAKEEHDRKLNKANQEYKATLADAEKMFDVRTKRAEEEELIEVKQWTQATHEWLARTTAHLEKGEEELRTLRTAMTNTERNDAPAPPKAPPAATLDTPPPELLCPLTHELMVNPVIAADGHTYERKAIEEWFLNSPQDPGPRSPKTDAVLPSWMLIPNVMAKTMCDGFREKKKSLELAKE